MDIFRPKSAVSISIALIVFGLFYVQRNSLSNYYANKAGEFYRENKTDKALDSFLFADVLAERSGSAETKIRRAQVFYESGNLDLAEKEILQALEADSKNPKALKFLGDVKYRQEKFSEAEEYYNAAYKLSPSTEYLIAKTRNLIREGKVFNAQQVLLSDKNFPEESSYYLGLIEFNKDGKFPEELLEIENGKYKKEIGEVRNFCESGNAGNNSDYGLVVKADLFNRINETDFAFLDISSVLERNDKYCDAYTVLGKSLMIIGEHEKSAQAFKKCLSLDVNNLQALSFLAGAYEKLGDGQKMQEYKERYEYLMKQ